jgi:hypothetical protein
MEWKSMQTTLSPKIKVEKPRFLMSKLCAQSITSERKITSKQKLVRECSYAFTTLQKPKAIMI